VQLLRLQFVRNSISCNTLGQAQRQRQSSASKIQPQFGGSAQRCSDAQRCFRRNLLFGPQNFVDRLRWLTQDLRKLPLRPTARV
jgi:hypothetical protein